MKRAMLRNARTWAVLMRKAVTFWWDVMGFGDIPWDGRPLQWRGRRR